LDDSSANQTLHVSLLRELYRPNKNALCSNTVLVGTREWVSNV